MTLFGLNFVGASTLLAVALKEHADVDIGFGIGVKVGREGSRGGFTSFSYGSW